MTALGAYVVSISATALISGIITGILKESSIGKPVKLVCNLVLMIAILQPVVQGDWKRIGEIKLPEFPKGFEAACQGESNARNAAAAIIKREAEAYILDKASAMGMGITVEVFLSDDDPPVPASAELSGTVSPYLKLRLEEMIQEDLNIAKENLIWIG